MRERRAPSSAFLTRQLGDGIVSVAIITAAAVNGEGAREVVSVAVGWRSVWLEFLRPLFSVCTLSETTHSLSGNNFELYFQRSLAGKGNPCGRPCKVWEHPFGKKSHAVVSTYYSHPRGRGLSCIVLPRSAISSIDFGPYTASYEAGNVLHGLSHEGRIHRRSDIC